MASIEDLHPVRIDVRPASVIQGPPYAYKNQSNPRGSLFISNWNKFHDDIHEERRGSKKDVKNLLDLFTQIGYDGRTVVEDLTKQQLFDVLKRFRDEDIHSSVDSLVAVFMSHGVTDYTFVASDGEEIHVQDIYRMFNNDECPALKGKPKIFIFQFCRGSEQSAINLGALDIDGKNLGLGSLGQPEVKLSEIRLCFSTLAGYVSYRDPIRGSVYIQHLCSVLMEWAKDMNMADLILKINAQLQTTSYQQLCEYHLLGCTRRFFFNPLGNRRNDKSSTSQESRKVSLGICVVTGLAAASIAYFGNGPTLFSVASIPCLGNNPMLLLGSVASIAHLGNGPTSSSMMSAANLGNGPTGLAFLRKVPSTLITISAVIWTILSLMFWTSSSREKKNQEDDTYPHGQGGTVFFVNNLEGCKRDVLQLHRVFTGLGYKTVIVRNTTSSQTLTEFLHQHKSKVNGPLVVVFFGYGYGDYLFTEQSGRESFSFKAFCEKLNYVRGDGYPSVVFTSTCLKARASHTIVHSKLQKPLQDTFHFCTKINGTCEGGSLLTKAILRTIEETDPSHDFSTFVENITSRMEESLENKKADQYHTDVRYYGVTKKLFFPHPHH